MNLVTHPFALCLCLTVVGFALPVTANIDAETFRLLNSFEPFYLKYKAASALAEWNYQTNMTTFNQEILTQAQTKEESFIQTYCNVVASLIGNLSNIEIQNVTIKRLVKLVTMACDNGKDTEARNEEFSRVVNTMTEQYSNAKVLIDDKLMSLDPDLTNLLATSTNFTLLLKAWKGWYDESTKEMKPLYIKYVDLYNKKALGMGLSSAKDIWQQMYEHEPRDQFEHDLEELWEGVLPVYKQLHAYVRYMLRNSTYADYPEYFPKSGHIPMHILGNMWAQSWSTLYNKLAPHPTKPSLDVTDSMKAQNYTVRKIFNMSDEFFQSLGMQKMPDVFWKKSMFERPENRSVVCHASAHSLYNKDDVRIKMCTTITHKDLVTVHHEMGHIQYFLEYGKHPVQFQESANPGFHEAIGDTVALSVTTPKHLRQIGLLTAETDPDVIRNFLMMTALQKIVFLPFGYLVDKWRWKVFDGTIKPDNYSNEWWNLVCKFQGVYPPVNRSNASFDPGAKFHIPASSKYISYFISHILQFQFYGKMCEYANNTEGLVNCDFFNSTAAGLPFRRMMAEGTSKHWADVLEGFTGSRNYNASAIREYFSPLTEWLEVFNNATGEKIGWDDECPSAPSMPSTAPSSAGTSVEVQTTTPLTGVQTTTTPTDVETTTPPSTDDETKTPPLNGDDTTTPPPSGDETTTA
jgi:peptidyl-dipeptidase A